MKKKMTEAETECEERQRQTRKQGQRERDGGAGRKDVGRARTTLSMALRQTRPECLLLPLQYMDMEKARAVPAVDGTVATST